MPTNRVPLALSIAPAFLLLACQTPIDSAKLATDIKADGAKNNLTYRDVTCPPNQTAKAGGTFQCTITDDQGTAGTYTVTMTDATGAVTYKLDGKYVDMKKAGDDLEAKLSASAGGKVDVKCPDKNVLAKAGLIVVCDATAGETTRKVILTGTDGDGNFDIAFQ